MIKNSVERTHLYHAVVAGIKQWLPRDWEITVTHVLREANACADWLAKLGSSGNDQLTVWNTPPEGLRSYLRADYMGCVFIWVLCFTLKHQKKKKKNSNNGTRGFMPPFFYFCLMMWIAADMR